MVITSLGKTPLEVVHEAFVRAFGDYEVRMDLPIDRFAEMLHTRDVTLDLSVGCFEEQDLVGFVLCGFRKLDGFDWCYDGGTGIVPEHRHQGVGRKLVETWLDVLRNRGVAGVLLEVLENNTPAFELYQKAGFQVSRSFSCCRCNKALLAAAGHTFDIVDDMAHYLALDCDALLTFKPSWQNARESVVNAIDRHAYVALTTGSRVLGYGLVHTASGNIPQIGVASDYRDTGLEGAILDELARRTSRETLVFLNIEQGDYLERKLTELGFERFVGQYEMEYRC